MRDYTTQPFTFLTYKAWSLVWKPPVMVDQGLFLVRVPPDLPEMSAEMYQQLMMLRIQWMILDWITEASESQETTAQRLAQALQVLYSQQMPPALYLPGSKELRPLMAWAEDWSEALVRHNETLMTKFELHNGWIFPISVQLPREAALQQAWQSEHDTEFTLETWLEYLTADMS